MSFAVRLSRGTPRKAVVHDVTCHHYERVRVSECLPEVSTLEEARAAAEAKGRTHIVECGHCM